MPPPGPALPPLPAVPPRLRDRGSIHRRRSRWHGQACARCRRERIGGSASGWLGLRIGELVPPRRVGAGARTGDRGGGGGEEKPGFDLVSRKLPEAVTR